MHSHEVAERHSHAHPRARAHTGTRASAPTHRCTHSASRYKQVRTDTLSGKRPKTREHIAHTRIHRHMCSSPRACIRGTDRHKQVHRTHTQGHISVSAQYVTHTHVHTHGHTPALSPPPAAGSWLPAKLGAFCWVCTTFHRL